MELVLDKRDRLILSELERDSRQPLSKIGGKCGLSASTVEYRIKKWAQEGLISRMFCVWNLAAMGYKTYRLYLKLENVPSTVEEKFVKEYSSKQGVQWFAVTQGSWDYIIRFMLKDEGDFKAAVSQLLEKYGKYVKAKDIAITTFQAYLPIEYFLGTPRKKLDFRAKTLQANLDGKDHEILKQLFDDARAPTTQIAKKAGISPDAVQYRIKRMVKDGVVNGFTCWFDRRKLGYSYYKAFFWMQYISPQEEERFLRYCENHPNIVFINRVIGNWDVELDFDARNPQELHEMIKVIRNKFSNIMRDHATLAILQDYLPNPLSGLNATI